MDHLICQNPSATLLALEAHIVFTKNRTTPWLSHKSEEERKKQPPVARKLTLIHKRKLKRKFGEQLSLSEQEEDVLRRKQLQAERHNQKVLLEKEKLTGDIVKHGLWQTPSQVETYLWNIRLKTGKHKLVKIQLRFCKTVLKQKYSTRSIGHEFK